MYTLTSKDILDAINVASKNNAKIRLILDKSQKANTSFDGKNNTEKYIEKNDCIVRWRGGKSGKLNSMHRKMAIFDGETVFIGSTNWSYTGLDPDRKDGNREDGMIYKNEILAKAITERFFDDWERADREYNLGAEDR